MAALARTLLEAMPPGMSHAGTAVSLSGLIDLIAKVDDLLTEHAMGISQVTLADTMAWANPLSVKRMVEGRPYSLAPTRP